MSAKLTTRRVIFDVDGTLIDSAPGIINGYRHMFAQLGIEPPSADALRADIGPPLSAIAGRYGVPDSELDRAIEIYRDRYLDQGIYEATVYPGAAELLTRLDGAGFALATATAKRTNNAEAILDAHNLLGFFEVLGAAEPPDRTTKADILSWVLNQWSTTASRSIAMVGDRHFDIAGARSLGLTAIGATWGYGTEEELANEGADSLCATFTELEGSLFAR